MLPCTCEHSTTHVTKLRSSHGYFLQGVWVDDTGIRRFEELREGSRGLSKVVEENRGVGIEVQISDFDTQFGNFADRCRVTWLARSDVRRSRSKSRSSREVHTGELFLVNYLD